MLEKHINRKVVGMIEWGSDCCDYLAFPSGRSIEKNKIVYFVLDRI